MCTGAEEVIIQATSDDRCWAGNEQLITLSNIALEHLSAVLECFFVSIYSKRLAITYHPCKQLYVVLSGQAGLIG